MDGAIQALWHMGSLGSGACRVVGSRTNGMTSAFGLRGVAYRAAYLVAWENVSAPICAAFRCRPNSPHDMVSWRPPRRKGALQFVAARCSATDQTLTVPSRLPATSVLRPEVRVRIASA